MLKNYLKVALRNLSRNKGYSFINIFGLAISLVCLISILLFVKHEWSHDRFQENADRIYRVSQELFFRGQWQRVALATPIMGPEMKRQFPEVEQAGRITFMPQRQIAHDNDKFTANIQFVDSEIIPLMSINMLNSHSAGLERKHTVALAKSVAEKLFGADNPIGKTIRLDNQLDLEVTGVFQDYPTNSHLRFSVMVSIETLTELWGPGALQSKQSNNYYTYILLKEKVAPAALEAKFPAFMAKHYGEAGRQIRHPFLEPLSSIYLHSDTQYDTGISGNIYYLYLMLAVAIVVLSIACINFINLTTARSMKRAREIGVRKVCGSNRGRLIRQFLGESVLLSLIAFLLALALIEILMPLFTAIMGKAAGFSLFNDLWFVVGLLGVVLAVGLFSGLYPALIISQIKPAQALKNMNEHQSGGFSLRKGLLTFQFVSSVVLLVCSLLVYQQLNYLRNKDLGFERENIFFVRLRSPEAKSNADVLKTELLQQSAIKNVCRTSRILGNTFGEWRVTPPRGSDTTMIKTLFVDEDFIETFNLDIQAGRAFRQELGTDRNAFLVNQPVADLFGEADLIGKEIEVLGKNRGSIIGIIGNFHYESLRAVTEPLVITLADLQRTRYLAIRTDVGKLRDAINSAKQIWERILPHHMFDFTILDQHLDRIYRSEQRLAKLVLIFTAFAVFITCLGLFGLITIIALQRRKEIGIRKVLGASVTGIVGLLSTEFIKLVLLANLLAWPLAWYLMSHWLQNFAYRIEIEWWVFALAGGMALLIALLTVGYQAVRAALANPVEALRYE